MRKIGENINYPSHMTIILNGNVVRLNRTSESGVYTITSHQHQKVYKTKDGLYIRKPKLFYPDDYDV